MARDIPIGNGNVLIAFDENYQIREFYFPYVGQENHTSNHPFRFGVWVNGRFSWVNKEKWDIKKDYLNDSLVTQVSLTNKESNIQIFCNDFVDFHENIYLKKLIIKNLSNEKKEIRLFFCHDFHIYGTEIGDTASFRPETKGILHYKNKRYFLVNTSSHPKCKKCGVDQFACGEKESDSHEGAWKDAEDGNLSNNPIAQGAVDSVVALHLKVKPKSSQTGFYWVCIGRSWNEVDTLNTILIGKTPELLLRRTLDYWHLWTNKEKLNCDLLPEKVARLYKRSLLILRTQIDNDGSIIAASDTDNTKFNRDTYSYMWTRDASLIAYGLDICGYSEITRRFFNFCGKIIEKEGYFMHKYNPSGTVASSWHPWIKEGKLQLPIQEDETALVIWALWNHYKIYKDIEFVKPLYKSLIKNTADFMVEYRDEKTKLPLESYDLWEEQRGIFTFTTAAVFGGLMAASYFTRAFGEDNFADIYKNAAIEIKEAMEKYLYIPKEKRFAKKVVIKDNGKLEVDLTIDASLYGIFAFGVFKEDDEKVQNTMNQIREKLWCNTKIGGLARYENDIYHRVNSNVPGNPWFITTLWLAEYYIAIAQNEESLKKGLELMEWVASKALESGVLSEQINPNNGEFLSVSPLTWSHGSFITVVQQYINKLLDFVNPPCELPKFFKYN